VNYLEIVLPVLKVVGLLALKWLLYCLDSALTLFLQWAIFMPVVFLNLSALCPLTFISPHFIEQTLMMLMLSLVTFCLEPISVSTVSHCKPQGEIALAGRNRPRSHSPHRNQYLHSSLIAASREGALNSLKALIWPVLFLYLK
jgi:hypothetical protein